MHEEMKVTIEGTTPLLLGNGIAADPSNPAVILRGKVTKKRTKTPADHEELARMDWELSLYVIDGKVALPGMNFGSSIIEGARKFKMGKQAESGLCVANDAILDFPDKNKSINELYESGKYAFRRMVARKSGRIVAVSPRFNEWRATFKLLFDDELCDPENVREWIRMAGRMAGIGAYRKQFGKYRLLE